MVLPSGLPSFTERKPALGWESTIGACQITVLCATTLDLSLLRVGRKEGRDSYASQGGQLAISRSQSAGELALHDRNPNHCSELTMPGFPTQDRPADSAF